MCVALAAACFLLAKLDVREKPMYSRPEEMLKRFRIIFIPVLFD
jgi:hypothetical protein